MTRQQTVFLSLGLVLLALFTALGIAVRVHPAEIDLAIRDGLNGQWQHPAGQVATVLSAILGPVLPFLLGLFLAVAAAVALRRSDRERIWLLVRLLLVLVICRVTGIIAKVLFTRERPRSYPDWSYPSGHVTSVAATAFTMILFVRWLAPRLMRVTILLSVLLTGIAAADRLVLGVHWFTDTVGAVLAVVGMGLIVATLLQLLSPRTTDPLQASNSDLSTQA